MKILAYIINLLGLRDCVSWAFTASDEVSCATDTLADFSPGYLIKYEVPSTVILSSQQETARALDIPPDIHVLILSDPTLTLFRSAVGKK